MADTSRDWTLRRPPDALIERYRGSGQWTDDTLGALLDGWLATGPQRTCRIWSAERPCRTRFATLRAEARRVAAGLRAQGVGPGDVVAFQLPNWMEAVVTFAALSMLGAVVVPIVHYYGVKEVGFALRESRAKVLIVADRFRRTDHVAALAILRPTLPDLERVVMVRSGAAPLPDDVVPYTSLAEGGLLEGLPEVDPDAPAVIGYTSGTTADPKGVIHTHRSLIAEIRQLAAIQLAGGRPTLIAAPVAHAIGLLGGLLLPVFRGQDVHLLDVWDPDVVLDAMLAEDLTAGSGATVFLLSLLDHPKFSSAHAARMPWLGLGSAPVPVAVADRAAALGIAISRVYGSTEHPSATGAAPGAPHEKRTRTDGHALAGVELRIVDESGASLPPGQAGEIWSRGPDLFAGYTDPALTREAFHDDGWYASGDIGVLDDDAYLTITDRKKDIVIRGGANISAAEIEELLARLPGVTEVAVVAAPDPRFGEHACAYLRLRPGAAAPGLAELQRHLDACGLARPKWPEELHVVDDFPRTASGKIKKFVLRDALRAAPGRGA